MKKLISLFSITLMLFMTTAYLPCEAAVDKTINANLKTKRVPAGTVIKMKSLDAVSSNSSSIGDGFDMMIIENVIVENETVIPKGSVVRGTLESVTAPKMLYKGGSIRLYFDHVVSSTGKQVTFYAGLCNSPYITYDGSLSSKTNYGTAIGETAEKSKNMVTDSTSWMWENTGAAKYVTAPVTAVVSAAGAGVYFVGGSVVDLFKKGKNITINQGDVIQVQLIKPLDMPVY